MEIVIVGSIALDTIVTPWGKAEECVGGSATYFSMAASHFGPVNLVAVVGSDFPSDARAMLEGRGVDCTGLEVAEGKTFRWGGEYRQDVNQRDTLFTHLNVFEHFHPKLPAGYRDADCVFLANIHPSLQMEVLEQSNQPKLVALDTMNLWIETARAELLNVLKRVDLLFVNDEEARQLTGKHSLPHAAAEIHAMGPRWVVVKKGEHGSLFFSDDFCFALPAMLLEQVQDPTGAGDAFAGGFLGHFARQAREQIDAPTEETLRGSMIFGTVLSSYVTEAFGLERLRRLDAADIDHRYGELRALTRWPEA